MGKIEFFKSKGIALWDGINCWPRKGRLDSNIKNEASNDFTSLFHIHPNIKSVFSNGAKAYKTFMKKICTCNF